MTPMIDVVFLLLIFFVCASVGQVPEMLLPTKLSPGALSAQEVVEPVKPLGDVWIRLRRTADSRTEFEVQNRLLADFDALKQMLIELADTAPEIPIILDIEGDIPMQDVIAVLDLCQVIGFETIDFAVDAKAASGTPPGKN